MGAGEKVLDLEGCANAALSLFACRMSPVEVTAAL